MLKSPRYSSVQPTSILNQISSTLVDKMNAAKRNQAKAERLSLENKGNNASNTNPHVGLTGSGNDANSRASGSAPLAIMKPNLTVGKAQSSLASSPYQAHGHLPQFDGAGKAQTSSVYREQGVQPLPHVHLPSETSYSDKQSPGDTSDHRVNGPSAHTASTTYHSSVNFGYDGGRDSPPLKNPNTPKDPKDPKDKQPSQPAFDMMGVTQADFNKQRESTNNAWHQGNVKDFFQDLREKECSIIAPQQRANGNHQKSLGTRQGTLI